MDASLEEGGWAVYDDVGSPQLCAVCLELAEQGFQCRVPVRMWRVFVCRLCANTLACAFAQANGLALVPATGTATATATATGTERQIAEAWRTGDLEGLLPPRREDDEE